MTETIEPYTNTGAPGPVVAAQSTMRQWFVRRGGLTTPVAVSADADASFSSATPALDSDRTAAVGELTTFQSAYKQQFVREGGLLDIATLADDSSSGGGGSGGSGGGGNGPDPINYPDEPGKFGNPVHPTQIDIQIPDGTFYGRRKIFAEGSTTNWVYIDITIVSAPPFRTAGRVVIHPALSLEYTMEFRKMTREEVFATIDGRSFRLQQDVGGIDTSTPIALTDEFYGMNWTYSVTAQAFWRYITFRTERFGLGDYRP